MIPAGNYSAAVSSLNRKCNYNTALAKMLTGNNDGALADFECIEDPCAKTNYMKAVLGARMENADMMFENLTKAIQAKPKIAKFAAGDREFIDYFADPNFMALISSVE